MMRSLAAQVKIPWAYAQARPPLAMPLYEWKTLVKKDFHRIVELRDLH